MDRQRESGNGNSILQTFCTSVQFNGIEGSCLEDKQTNRFLKMSDSDSDSDIENLAQGVKRSLRQMQQQTENSNEPIAGPSSRNDPSNIKFRDILKTYNNDLLTAYYTRIGFKNHSRFWLTDFHFSVNFNFHEDYQNIYLLTALDEILEAFTSMLREIKEHFEGDLNRIIYITLLHQGLTPKLNLGPLNFSEDSIENIVKKLHTQLQSALISHRTLKVDKSLHVKVVVFGKVPTVHRLPNAIA